MTPDSDTTSSRASARATSSDPNAPASAVAPDPADAGVSAGTGIAALGALPDPAGILFDLDGTLVDTVFVRTEAWRRALEEAGMTVEPSHLAGYMGSDGRWLAKEVARAVGRTLDDRTASDLDARHGVLFDELNQRPVPLPGAGELLAALERSDVVFAIATSSQPGQVAVSLAALQLPAPPPVVNGGHVAHAKPEPDLLLAGARELGLPPERCWYVGDSRWDMMASARAGMTGIGVTTGASDAQALVEAGATVAVPDLGVVLTALRERGLV